MTTPRILVVGASMGGVHALRQLAADLPAGFPAPVLMVLHIGHHHSVLPSLLSAQSALPARHAVDRMPLRAGEIVVAPPDQHMLVEADQIRLSRGPKEHFSRPAIDPLFRSAALAHGAGAVGVILTGLLDDGTAGLQAIKARGGVAIVQDPQDAQEPSMPRSALRHVQVDHCVPLARMGEVCAAVMTLPPGTDQAAPEWLRHEQMVANRQGNPVNHLRQIAKPSTFVCPDCSGSLWELDNVQPARFRCHTGHAYTLRTLQHAHSLATDEALWSALRALQEQKLLLDRCRDASPSQDTNSSGTDSELHELEMLRRLIEQHVTPEEA
jgi:two-component system chemotaxis response regulator CheB